MVLVIMSLLASDVWSQTSGPQEREASISGGPVRLPQPQTRQATKTGDNKRKGSVQGDRNVREVTEKVTREEGVTVRPDPGLSDFEVFVSRLAASSRAVLSKENDQPIVIRRFGLDLATGAIADETDDGPTLVPEDYIVGPGDEMLLNLWGGVEANLRLRVDRSGAVAIPRIGSVTVNGVRFADLRRVISERVGKQFRNFDLSVALGEVKSIRVYVSGFVAKPGAYPVSGLSTMLQAVMLAGGPNAVGSYRNIQLRRANAVISTLDLYDFMLKGDRSADRLLRSGDVIHVGSVGSQVGVIGSVNNPAVFELRASDTVTDVLRMAAGVSAVASRGQAALYSFEDKAGRSLKTLDLKADSQVQLRHGDVLRIFSVADISQPNQDAGKKIRVEGEVLRPGDYVLPAGSSLRDALSAAGGLTGNAFLFGTEFNRESVRMAQQESYERSLLDLETEFRKSLNGPKMDERPEDKNMRGLAQNKLIERLRAVKPSGRVVMQFTSNDNQLPLLLLEDGDRIYVPAKPTTVSVYGSVFNAGSYLFTPGRELDEYLRQSGGPTKEADKSSVFVVRANGEVISSRMRKGGWFSNGDIGAVQAMAGDTIFVPEEFHRTASIQETKDWAQILYQFAIGVATVKAIK